MPFWIIPTACIIAALIVAAINAADGGGDIDF
jgi:hypothetical protein